MFSPTACVLVLVCWFCLFLCCYDPLILLHLWFKLVGLVTMDPFLLLWILLCLLFGCGSLGLAVACCCFWCLDPDPNPVPAPAPAPVPFAVLGALIPRPWA